MNEENEGQVDHALAMKRQNICVRSFNCGWRRISCTGTAEWEAAVSYFRKPVDPFNICIYVFSLTTVYTMFYAS